MQSLSVSNFRCFRQAQEVPLAPMTVLVGENSTGKSAFLAAVRLAWDIAHGAMEPDFNEEPFELGAFDQVANYVGGRAGRAKRFSIGCTVAGRGFSKRAPTQLRYSATFQRSGWEPAIAEWRAQCGKYLLSITPQEGKKKVVVRFGRPGRRPFEATIEHPGTLPSYTPGRFSPLWFFRYTLARDHKAARFSQAEEEAYHYLLGFAFPHGDVPRPRALAPIRTSPARTYNPKTERPQPGGGHVPTVLARMASATSAEWAQLKKRMEAFGSHSGLFTELAVKNLVRRGGGPFQIKVKVHGAADNLVDVGYGVSQALPVLVDSLMGERDEMLLVQQPEVHLHPRAQAQLATLMAHLVGHEHRRFVIETHSDHFVDRLRLEVRKGDAIRAPDVVVVYFEFQGAAVVMHPIRLDDAGNLTKVPGGYRRFFLEEERQLLEG